jgi:hypothetical protein
MRRLLRVGVLIALIVAITASVVLAEEGDGRREGLRKKMMERRKKMDALRGLNMPLMSSEKVRTELKRHRGVVEDLAKAIKDMRDAAKKEIEGGAAPKAVLEKFLPQSKELAKKLIAEFTRHSQALAELAKTEGEGAVDPLAKRLLMPPRGARGEGERGRGRARRRRPEAEGDKEAQPEGEPNPFNE